MKNIFLVMLIIFSFTTSFAEDVFTNEVVKSTALTQSLFMLEGAGGNITALIGEDGVLLVDDDFAQMADKLVTKLKELGGGVPRYIINTHFHYDHTGGNQVFGKTATIIATTEVRARLMSEQTLWKKQHPAIPVIGFPSLTFDQSLSLHTNNQDIRIVHFAHGHTDGDTVVFFNQGKVVSMGDLYFSGMYPIFHPEHKGRLDGVVKNLKLILNQISSETQIVPGHGPLSNKAELQKYYEMILDSIKTVRQGIKKGLILKQIQNKGINKKWESFSHGYLTTEKWIALIYSDLFPVIISEAS